MKDQEQKRSRSDIHVWSSNAESKHHMKSESTQLQCCPYIQVAEVIIVRVDSEEYNCSNLKVVQVHVTTQSHHGAAVTGSPVGPIGLGLGRVQALSQKVQTMLTWMFLCP